MQFPLWKNWKVTVPVSGSPSLLVTWATSYRPEPSGRAVLSATTESSAALCSVVDVIGSTLTTTDVSFASLHLPATALLSESPANVAIHL